MKKHLSAYRFQGSSLVEVLTSLSVLSITFMGGWMLFRLIMGIHSPVEEFRTQLLTRQVLYETFTTEALPGEKILMGRTLVRSVTLLETQPPLLEISVRCYYQNRLLETRTIITPLRQLNHEKLFKTNGKGIYPFGNDDRDDPDGFDRPVRSSDVSDF
ncbi:MAG: hypothetical protein SF052_14290 [Bacteroidia bacterium]|nr:hypothetical protein [Bacteroidia bacterium]